MGLSLPLEESQDTNGEPQESYEQEQRSHGITIPGIPISGSQLKFNRATGSAYRPKEHKQRIFEIYEFASRYIEQNGFTAPLFPNGVPIYMSIIFRFPYRKQDYRTGARAGELKPNAPLYVIGNKDLDNLLKPLKDGFKGLFYADDRQIVKYINIVKQYSKTPNTFVQVGELHERS